MGQDVVIGTRALEAIRRIDVAATRRIKAPDALGVPIMGCGYGRRTYVLPSDLALRRCGMRTAPLVSLDGNTKRVLQRIILHGQQHPMLPDHTRRAELWQARVWRARVRQGIRRGEGRAGSIVVTETHAVSRAVRAHISCPKFSATVTRRANKCAASLSIRSNYAAMRLCRLRSFGLQNSPSKLALERRRQQQQGSKLAANQAWSNYLTQPGWHGGLKVKDHRRASFYLRAEAA